MSFRLLQDSVIQINAILSQKFKIFTGQQVCWKQKFIYQTHSNNKTVL